MPRLVSRNRTTSHGRTTHLTFGTNLRVSVVKRYCSGRVTGLIRRNGVDVRLISSTIGHILHVGFHLKLFSGPCAPASARGRHFLLPRDLTVTRGLTRRAVILLGGRGGMLPLTGKGGPAVTIVKPLMRGYTRLLKS